MNTRQWLHLVLAAFMAVGPGCAAPMRIGDREYESMRIKEGKTNLYPHMSWIGDGTATAGIIAARIKGEPSNSGFLEVEKFYDLPPAFGSGSEKRVGPALLLERVMGKSKVYSYNVETLAPGISFLFQRYGMLTGQQTKLRFLYGHRHDFGESRVSTYEGDEGSNILKWSGTTVLYRSEQFYRLLNKAEFYGRGDIDLSSSKKSSMMVDVDPTAKVKMVRTPINPKYDPANENTHWTIGTVANIVRFGQGTKDVTVRAGLEWSDEREFQAKSVRPMVGLTFFGEHLTVMVWKKFVYKDGGKPDAPDSVGVSVWATAWSW